MAEDTRDPNAASEEVADDATSGAALLVTFYGRRNDEQIQELHERLYRSLGPEPREARAPRVWSNLNETTGLCFDPPGDGPHDTTVLQVALNAPENAADNTAGAWEGLRGKLEGVLNTKDLDGMDDIWGYTLVYQAVLKEGFDANKVLKELLPAVGRLRSSGDLGLRLPSRVPSGWAWLLGIPDRGDGPDAGMVYVALASEGEERELISQFYSMSAGSVAELLEPDLMAHKGYHHMRQYRNEYRERRYEEKLGNLRQTTDDLLEDLRNTDHLLKDLQGGGEGSSRPSRLEALFQLYCRLLTVVSVLRGLQVGMLQQSENLDEWRSQGRDNETLELHQRQLKTATRELELKVEPLQSDLEIADKAVSAARLQMDKEHEKRERRVEKKEAIRQHRMQAVLAVVAAALGLPALVPILESFTGNAFVEFLAQFVRIASVVIVIALLAIPIWFLWRLIRPIMHRRLNRRRTNHEPKEAEIHVSEEK